MRCAAECPKHPRPMRPPTEDPGIVSAELLPTPLELRQELPLSETGASFVQAQRAAVRAVLQGHDDRLLCVVGPCSIHDVDAAFAYAEQLAAQAASYADALVVVMRVYFEKPRTSVGWRGLLHDPRLDGSLRVHEGLRLARSLLVRLADRGVAAGTEVLDPITPRYIADAITWGAIGARTAESSIHRELVSGLGFPVGIKNATSGSVQVAIDAIGAAARGRRLPGVTLDGRAAVLTTAGNADGHLILRGGDSGPNFAAAPVRQALEALMGGRRRRDERRAGR